MGALVLGFADQLREKGAGLAQPFLLIPTSHFCQRPDLAWRFRPRATPPAPSGADCVGRRPEATSLPLAHGAQPLQEGGNFFFCGMALVGNVTSPYLLAWGDP